MPQTQSLPVTPYDCPAERSRNTGAWNSDSARSDYREDMTTLVADTAEIADDLDRLIHQVARTVGHVATREVSKGMLDAALTLVNSVRQLLADEADC